MKLYLLSQTEETGYGTYDSALVCAENEDDAKTITPYGKVFDGQDGTWCRRLSSIKCKEIGVANDKQKRGVIIASFNAG